jgi:hypothetical protein
MKTTNPICKDVTTSTSFQGEELNLRNFAKLTFGKIGNGGGGGQST